MSVGTVRIQLKAIFTKTDTHRKADPMALLSRMRRFTRTDDNSCAIGA